MRTPGNSEMVARRGMPGWFWVLVVLVIVMLVIWLASQTLVPA
jgi:hypothetical protein